MCGIVGYSGKRSAQEVLLNGLEKLEYRGYDSAGVALALEGGIHVVKSKGRLEVLRRKLEAENLPESFCGIGHTRWATHGEPSDVIDNIERDFLKKDHLQVTIHYDPIVTSDAAVGILRSRLMEKARQMDPRLSIHDLRIVPGDSHTNVLFDLVFPAGYTGDQVELLSQLEQFIKEQDAAYSCIIKVEQSYTAAHQS